MLVIDELKEAGVSRVHCNLESSIKYLDTTAILL